MRNRQCMSWLQRIGLSLMLAVLGNSNALAGDDPFAGLEATFQRLPAHEALAAEILRLISLRSDIRVYFDKYNPAFCGRHDAKLRAIILSDWCSERLKNEDGRYNWFVVEKVASELGHILSGHGVRQESWEVRTQDELIDAQEFAGWAMHRLGATLDEARASLVVTPSPGTFPVPAEASSINAIERGWDRASR